MSSKLEIPKKKPNHFFIFDKTKYTEVKYLTQHELSENWQQVIPNYNNHKLISNNFPSSIILELLSLKIFKSFFKNPHL